MRMSEYFLPTLKESPKEAEIISHELMLRAGMIKQTSAGIYAWLPLGQRVLKKIEQIVREEQDAAGAQELLMPTLQSADLWRESGRYDDYGKEMLRIEDRQGRDLLYGPTNEEMITDIFRSHVKSYKDLPKNLYHIQWKFRDEIRPRFGVMRGREFLMKDNYSFDLDYEGALYSYQKMFLSYLRTFSRMGLRAIPMRADTGPIGGDLSHEFIILADTGESEVFADAKWHDMDVTASGLSYDDRDKLSSYYDEMTSIYAATDEKHDENDCPDNLIKARGIEVGHIFNFGTKYSKAMNATVQNKDGDLVPVEMGSYGIGVSRLVGGIIEASHDNSGIIWPESVAPFKVGIINLDPEDQKCTDICNNLYNKLQDDFEVIYDDRSVRPGVKFANMDLIGIPWQIRKGSRQDEDTVIVKRRDSEEKHELSISDAMSMLADSQNLKKAA
jgi:prolyl-tRNA synthetase